MGRVTEAAAVSVETADRDLKEFGRMFKMARLDSGLSQTTLAAALDVKQSSISAWESGDSEPDRALVFRAENFLGLAPGTLSRPLGYGPPVETGKAAVRAKKVVRSVANARDAILADPKLSKNAKEALLASYRALTSPSRCTGGLARHEPKTAAVAA